MLATCCAGPRPSLFIPLCTALQLLPYNMETEQLEEATLDRWDRVAAAMALTPEQVRGSRVCKLRV